MKRSSSQSLVAVPSTKKSKVDDSRSLTCARKRTTDPLEVYEKVRWKICSCDFC
jgi:hypothetical protein